MTTDVHQLAGNRCDHSPASPRFFQLPAEHKPRPGILTELYKRVQDYYRKPRLLPTLNAANESKRQQRSERREACLLMLGALTHYLDIKTLRVGIPLRDGRSMRGLSMVELCDRAGLTLRRAERAIADLVRAGIVKVHRICEQDDHGSFKGLPAIRTISKSLFQAFGLGKRLVKERAKAHRNAHRLAGENDKGRQGLAMNAIKHRLHAGDRKPHSTDGVLAGLKAAIRSKPPD